MPQRRSPLPSRAIEADVLISLHAEAKRRGRPLATIVAEAVNRYVVETDRQRDACRSAR